MSTTRDVKDSAGKTSHLLAAGARATFQAFDVLVEFGAEATRAVLTKTEALAQTADHRYHEAADQGDRIVRKTVAEALGGVGRIADVAAGLVDRQIIRRVAESMKPYLIEDLVPEVIDGVLPEVQADVVPVLLTDLADDQHVQAMVAAQSKGVLVRGVTELRRRSGDADDRVEESAHRLFGRQGRGT
jgi:hypothetical protein